MGNRYQHSAGTTTVVRFTPHAAHLLALFLPVLLVGCHTDMWTQPKVHKPLQESEFFTDRSSARPQAPGTVARSADPSHLKVGNPFFTGIGQDGKLLDELPKEVALNAENLKRGQQRFQIYCSPCHGLTGDGKGMIAIRGLELRKKPGNYHTAKLRKMPLGHFYDVITNGFGAMYSYSTRIEPADRWRIAAYVRVLQASHNVPVSSLPPDKQAELDKSAGTETEAPHAGSEAH